MEFTAEDQYIVQALAEHLNTKYGGVYLIAGNDKQTLYEHLSNYEKECKVIGNIHENPELLEEK